MPDGTMPSEEREPTYSDVVGGKFNPDTLEWVKEEEEGPLQIKGTEVVPISGDDLLRAQINMEVDEQNRPKFATPEAVDAELARRKVETAKATIQAPEVGPQAEEVIEGEIVREVPKVNFYQGIRLDLETARKRFRGVTADAREAIRQRLQNAGVELGPGGGVDGYEDVERMTREEVEKKIREQEEAQETPPVIHLGGEQSEPEAVAGGGAAPEATPTPTPEVNRLEEMLEHDGQKLMENLGSYSGGDLTETDVSRLRDALAMTGINVAILGDDGVKVAAKDRVETGKKFLSAIGINDTEINALDGGLLMQKAQDRYFRTLISEVDPKLIEYRDSMSEESFDRRGYDSNKRKQVLENTRQRLGTAFDRVVSGMDFYDNTVSSHRVFQDRFKNWLDYSIVGRLERYRNLTKDAGIREKLKTPQDWVKEIRSQLAFLEKQESGGHVDAWLGMKMKLESAGTGFIQQVGIFEAMDDPSLADLKEKMEDEVRARAGIDVASKIWEDNKGDAKKLISAMVGRVGSEKEEAPAEKLKFFSMGWLETLSTAEGELGPRIGRAIQRYVAIGERDLQRYYREQELKEPNISATRKVELQNWLADPNNQKLGPNIFSDADLNEVAAHRERETIANDPSVGKDAEELAFRLMYLFGLAAKYDIDQGVAGYNCFYRDDLASMMRPNDAWQRNRMFSKVDIGPYEIVGQEKVYSNQPLRHVGFLVSYPDIVGEVRMRDGSLAPLMQVLFEGKFADVAWEEIPSKYDYGAFIRRMNTARTIESELTKLPPGDLKDIDYDAIAKLIGNLETAMIEYRALVQVVPPEDPEEHFRTSEGVEWSKRKKKRVQGKDDLMTQAVLRNKMIAIVRAHDARRGVKREDRWNLAQWTTMRRNLAQFMRPDYLDSFLGVGEISSMTAAASITIGGK